MHKLRFLRYGPNMTQKTAKQNHNLPTLFMLWQYVEIGVVVLKKYPNMVGEYWQTQKAKFVCSIFSEKGLTMHWVLGHPWSPWLPFDLVETLTSRWVLVHRWAIDYPLNPSPSVESLITPTAITLARIWPIFWNFVASIKYPLTAWDKYLAGLARNSRCFLGLI